MPFDSSGDAFCVQASSFEEDAEIKMRACDSANHKQMWFMDYYGQLRLRFNDEMCLIWQGRALKMSSKCKKKKRVQVQRAQNPRWRMPNTVFLLMKMVMKSRLIEKTLYK